MKNYQKSSELRIHNCENNYVKGSCLGAWPADTLWAWPVAEGSAPLPHLTEDEHPPELAASPVSCQLLLDLLCDQTGR